jgi:cell wall assembly regulator SMI1
MTDAQIAEQIQADWRRVHRWTYRHMDELRWTLSKPATSPQIVELEERIGVKVPVDLRASLESHNGQKDDRYGFFFEYPLLSLALIEKAQQLDASLTDEQLAQREQEEAAAIRKRTPEEFHGKIKADAKVLTRWIRIAGRENFLALDLDPGPEGALGQVVALGPDVTPRVIARSFRQLLQAWANVLESGQYELVEVEGRKLLRPKNGAESLEVLRQAALQAEGE